MYFATLPGIIGAPAIQLMGLEIGETTAQQEPGKLITAIDPWWGTGEFIYCRANGSIRAQGLCVLTPVFSTNAYRFDATEVPNTANLGRMLAVAMAPMSSGDFGWFQVSGICPVNSNASVAADTAIGIAAAGQAGANSAGKQILNARNVAPSSVTVAKASCTADSGSTLLNVPNSDGWFPGVYLGGTGIGIGAVVTSIAPGGRQVTMSVVTTAAVNGTVTATYNNTTVHFNTVHLNRSFAQGAIT